ncbi:ankyrin repeat domain protein [Nitzschia inconspicua]|uniref:Ankyrin repeat domain protein n=1 Tax=Nitzschia inconspicua TaxID=303405 RepID=A0A9K3LQT1_9STRA|nr:ankyrin repeat domain protein [Nitzschia inconspicua]
MASNFFCSTPREELEPATLTRQHSGIGDAYSVVRSTGSTVTVTRYHDEPEVDYDEGATELYRRIEGRDWDGAMARLESHPFEAKTWVSRKEHNSEKTRWRLLPLHATCIFRSPLALIEALIDVYRDGPQMKDDQGMLPVHLACRNGGSKGVILTLLNAFPESCKVKDRKGRTPLQIVEASGSQNVEAVTAAIRAFERETQASSVRMVNMTPDSTMGGAPPPVNEVDYEHRTLLFKLLLKKDWKAACARAETNPEEAATWIVTKGFNGNLRFLPLHKACVLQPPEDVIEKLLAAYPDGSKCRDQDGWLPVHCACFYGANDIVVTTLLGANPKGTQSKDDEGRLPLHYACLKGASQSVVDVLLENFPKGAMSKDDEGRLPIHHACSKGAPEGVIDALLKASPKGAQSKDDQGRLPLHHACRKSSSERIIRTLLRVYPRAAQIKDDQDKLPIHYACQNGASPSVINVLLTTYPESINVKNGFGYTPLAEARALENPKMDPIIHVLEKFKVEQDKIKVDAGENAIFEAKLDAMNKRVVHLEKLLGQVIDLGVEMKGSVKKVKDPYVLIDRMADRLANLDGSIEVSPAKMKDSESRSRGPFGRKNRVKK